MSNKPIRIQRRRTRGFNLQIHSVRRNGLNAKYVGRPTKWGNKYKVGDRIVTLGGEMILTAEWAIWHYRNDLINSPLIKEIGGLRGFNLACFCKEGVLCHADVLLELANK